MTVASKVIYTNEGSQLRLWEEALVVRGDKLNHRSPEPTSLWLGSPLVLFPQLKYHNYQILSTIKKRRKTFERL